MSNNPNSRTGRAMTFGSEFNYNPEEEENQSTIASEHSNARSVRTINSGYGNGTNANNNIRTVETNNTANRGFNNGLNTGNLSELFPNDESTVADEEEAVAANATANNSALSTAPLTGGRRNRKMNRKSNRKSHRKSHRKSNRKNRKSRKNRK